MWLACISFLAAPFWFNPLTFEWQVVMKDYADWMNWMSGRGGGALKSWDVWWTEENNFYRTLSGSSKLFYAVKVALHVFIGEGIRRSTLFETDFVVHKPWVNVGFLLAIFVSLVFLAKVFWNSSASFSYGVERGVKIIFTVSLFACCVVLVLEDTNFVRYFIAGYYFAAALAQIGLLFFSREMLKGMYRIHDLLLGHAIFFVLFILAALQFPALIQTWLLYHNALSTDVVVEDILKYSRRSQEKEGTGRGEREEELDVQVKELRQMLARQEAILHQMAGGGEAGADLGVSNALLTRNVSTDAIAALVSDSSNMSASLSQLRSSYAEPEDDGGRVMSMSNLNVWSGMAGVEAPHVEDDDSAGTRERGLTAPSVSSAGEFEFSQPDRMPPR